MSALHVPSQGESLVLVLDAQESRLARIPHGSHVAQRIAALVRGAAVMGVPAVATILDGDDAGPLAPGVRELFGDGVRHRRAFAALHDDALAAHLSALGRSTLVLAGVETHVAIQQTALAALQRGYRVFVAGDATGSRLADSCEMALSRLARAGAAVEPVEALLYEMCESTDGDAWLKLQSLLR